MLLKTEDMPKATLIVNAWNIISFKNISTKDYEALKAAWSWLAQSVIDSQKQGAKTAKNVKDVSPVKKKSKKKSKKKTRKRRK